MNELQIFNNSDFGEVRTIREGNTVLFCAIDVARALGYSNTTSAIQRHCRGVVKRDLIDGQGRTQETNFIPVGDIYRLAARSQLDGAEKFESWIFDEVVPSVMETGSYNLTPAPNMTQLEILSGAIDSLMQHEKQLAALTEAQAESNKRLDTVEQKIIQAADAFVAPSYNYDTWRAQANDAINELLEKNGLPQLVYRGQLYKKLENIAGVSLTNRQTRLRTRMKHEGATRTQQNAVTKLVVVARDKKLRAIFDGILREERAKSIMVW